jgi:hypothetical protein
MPRTLSNIEIYVNVAKTLGLTTERIESGHHSPLLISDGKKFTLINTKSPGFYPEARRWNAAFTASKILTQTILNRLGYKTINTELVKSGSFESLEILNDFISTLEPDFPALVKPNRGYDGKHIDIVENVEQLLTIAHTHFEAKNDFLIQPILTQDEYRILVINDSVELVHSKTNQHIIGDSTSTIEQLLEPLGENKKNLVFIEWQYKKLNLSPTSILNKDQRFDCHLAKIPSPSYYKTDTFDHNMEQWAITLAKAISSPVVGIDVFISGDLSDTTGYTLIELNSNPALYYLPTRCNDTTTGPRIVEKILRDYFNLTRS